MCDREEQRTGEKMMRCLASWVDKGSNFSVSTDTLADAIVRNSLKTGAAAQETLEHGDILKVVKEG